MTGKCKFLVLALLVFDKHFIQSLQSNLYKIIVKLLHYFVHQQVNKIIQNTCIDVFPLDSEIAYSLVYRMSLIWTEVL